MKLITLRELLPRRSGSRFVTINSEAIEYFYASTCKVSRTLGLTGDYMPATTISLRGTKRPLYVMEGCMEIERKLV